MVENAGKMEDDALDTSQIDGLLAAAGREVTADIIAAFQRSTANLLSLLLENIRDRDYSLAAKTAHAIKGAALNIGASGMSSRATEIENACKAGSGDDLETLLSKINGDFSETTNRLRQYLDAA